MSDDTKKTADVIGAELLGVLSGVRTGAVYSQAMLLLALAESGAVKVDRVFALMKFGAETLRQAAAVAGDPIAAQAHRLAADMLDELEPTVRNMVTKPAGAGHA